MAKSQALSVTVELLGVRAGSLAWSRERSECKNMWKGGNGGGGQRDHLGLAGRGLGQCVNAWYALHLSLGIVLLQAAHFVFRRLFLFSFY